MKNKYASTILVILLFSINCFANEKLIKAIHQVEASGRVGKVLGDGGKALGPLQIHRQCWVDATQFDKTIGGKYEDCADLEYSKKIFLAYQRRYSRFTGSNTEKMARLWNGGRGGIDSKTTDNYWNKVRKHLR